MNSLKLSKRVIGFALSVLFVNVALADANSDARIQAYKANKLIPQNVVLSTSTGAADSDEVVVFNKGTLSWKSDNALSVSYAPLLEKYGDMTIDELRTAMGPAGTFDWNAWAWTEDGWVSSEITAEQQEIREYLSLVGNNKLKSDRLTSSEALAYLQEQFNLITSAIENSIGGVLNAFPCEGIDFSGRVLTYADLSKCTGITGEQILSAGDIWETKLPAISFTGNESFEGKSISGADLSLCTGITVAQIMSASNIGGAQLPALTFSGNESFDGIDLGYTNLSSCSGITAAQIMSASDLRGTKLPAITFTGDESFDGKNLLSTDLSKCTGITEAQIGMASNIENIHITTAQYNEWKSTLQTKIKNKSVYVDGVRTRIQ